MADRLRPLWDFDDLDSTELRLREQLAREVDDAARAEVATQLARIEGLRGDFEAGDRLIEEAAARAGDGAIALARIDLERGRILRSSGSPEAALPLFRSAFETSLDAGAYFITADAAHMAALAAPDRSSFVAWTERGVELAEAHEEARHWLGPLLNNLGWERYENGEYQPALDAFERALRAREQDEGDREAIEIGRFAVGKTLRALGRSDEAVPLLEQAVAWAQSEGAPDGWFHEELAEEYAAVGRTNDAREQARLALPLLVEADPSFAEDADRVTRLRSIADD
jgi:tetratricopeptide (TPR) repeat protein